MRSKLDNILNLAEKLNCKIFIIDDNTVQIPKPVFQIISLANKLNIKIVIKSETIENKKPQIQLEPKQDDKNIKRCFYCREMVDPKSADIGYTTNEAFFHIPCDLKFRRI